MTKNEKYIVDMYVRYFGRAADAATIATYAEDKKTSVILKNIIADADAEKAELSTSDFVNNAFQNLFGRNATTKEMNKYSKVVDAGKDLPINSIVKSAAKADKAVYDNKIAVANKNAELGGAELDLSKISKGNLIDIKTVTTLADLQAKVAALPENNGVPSSIDGKTYILTTNVDSGKDFVGTAKNDLFLATAKNQWSVADSIDGGKGVDKLKIIGNAGVAFATADLLPVASTMKNIEILDIINNKDITVDTTSAEFKGITDLYTTSESTAAGKNADVTAAATTNVNVTATSAATTVETIAVNGGKNVTVVSKNNVLDTITVGGTTAAAGKVSVTSEGSAVGGVTLGAITVTGGTEITVNQYGKNAVNTTNTGGTITVTGNEKTTTVTVNQSAVATAAADVVGYVAGAVTVNDKNTTSTTLADTIETVTVKNAGVVAIDSGALKTLNLEGTITSVTANDLTVKTGITAVDTLALNLKGVTTTAITADADVKTLNIASSKDASTVTTLTSAGATAINVSGDAALTVTTLGAGAANQVITVTNTAGVTIGNVLGNDVTFTGGAGADSIILSANYTKAINMGAGDDTVVYAAAGAGGSLNGGAGNDTLVVSAASAIAGLPEVSGFEVLRAVGGNTATHNAHTFKALEVGANTISTTFTNVAAGVGLTVLASTGSNTIVTLANATGTADVFDLTLKSAAAINAGTVDLDGVETINVNSVDTGSVTAAHVNTLILTDGAADVAKSIVVTGDAGVNFSTTNLTKVTNFDASAVTAGDVTFVSGNTTLGEVVTIKGGAGDDTLTGHANTNDTIIGGAGDDTLVYAGRADTFTGGAGNDTFEINALGTKALHLTITDLTKGDIINIAGIDTGTATWNNAKVALGASATFDEYLDAASAGNGSSDSIARWFQFEGNTYLVNDNTAGTTFAATDAVVKITGLVDLGTSTLSNTDLTIA